MAFSTHTTDWCMSGFSLSCDILYQRHAAMQSILMIHYQDIRDCWNMELSSPRLLTAHVIQTFLRVLKKTSSTLISRLQVHWRMMLRIME